MSDPALATIDPGLAALLGAIVGGLASLAGTWLTGRQSSNAAKKQDQALAAASALLLQDDFWHYQATLARALDAHRWWDPAEQSKPQATINDRKTVLAKLVTATDTNNVADAQGWMDYLTQRCKTLVATQKLNDEDVVTMKLTFCLLERGRKALADLAGRTATDFRKSRVLEQLDDKGVLIKELIKGGCGELMKEHDDRASPDSPAPA